MKRANESGRQRLSRRTTGCVRCSDAQALDLSCPVVLIVDLRDGDLRCAGQSGDRRGAGAAVMDDRGGALEERLQIDFIDGEAVGLVVNNRTGRPHPRDTIARRPSARAAWISTLLTSPALCMLAKPK